MRPNQTKTDVQTRTEAFVTELVREKGADALIPWFLILSYLYYTCNQSAVTDEFFDDMCRRMLAEWSTLQHPHKHRIHESDLEAGTGYAVKVPERAKRAAELFLSHVIGVSDARTNPL